MEEKEKLGTQKKFGRKRKEDSKWEGRERGEREKEERRKRRERLYIYKE